MLYVLGTNTVEGCTCICDLSLPSYSISLPPRLSTYNVLFFIPGQRRMQALCSILHTGWKTEFHALHAIIEANHRRKLLFRWHHFF